MANKNSMLNISNNNKTTLIDSFNRVINYLRISVTDRCNQQCIYCFQGHAFNKLKRDDVLSFEEIYNFSLVAIANGITKVRLTGGEPLVRKDISYLVEQLASIQGIKDIAMTTNGVLLKKFATELKRAGLHRVNISLDTLDADKYSMITRGGKIDDALQGIEAAKKAHLDPVKINCVVIPGINENEIDDMRKFCEKSSLNLQFIQFMNLHHKVSSYNPNRIFSRPPMCETCNKLRLSSDGKIFPCLYSNLYVSIKNSNSYREALSEAVRIKPLTSNSSAFETMAEIGG